MAMSWKARRRWSLVVLLLGLPTYVVVAVTVVNSLERPSLWVELAVYLGLGIVWALPFRHLFRGVGQADPAARAGSGPAPEDGRGGDAG